MIAQSYKIPESVLVVIHFPDLQVLLLERASYVGYWQSVTGSQEDDEKQLRELHIRLRQKLETTGEAPKA